ncbi:MAG TPA: UvrD-helicase domain-containing protein, partial [Candidatus Obscuribacterales bacterium]
MKRTLYSGDRGSGKTAALVSQFWSWIDAGIDSGRILILAGHRQRHAQLLCRHLLAERSQKLGPLEIKVFPAWGRELLEAFLPLIDPRPFLLLHSPDTQFLMRRFYEAEGHRYFDHVLADKYFFRHLLRRQRRCAENCLSGEELMLRTRQLEESPLAAQANAFLTAFSRWLDVQTPRLLDITNQMQVLQQLAGHELVRTHAARYTHWLIDDLDETRPLEQMLYHALGQRAQEWVCAGNPQGGVERLMGAYTGFMHAIADDPATELISLPGTAPCWALAHKFSALLQHQLPEPASLNLRYEVQDAQHPSQMFELMGARILRLLAKGTPAHEIVCVTWFLDDLSVRQLSAHCQQLGIESEVFRGGETLQRHPLVNTLLSLLRLALWDVFRLDPAIPRLSGFDMAQIYRLCAGVDAFTLSRLRFELGDKLDAWGQVLKEQAGANPALGRLQDVVNRIRVHYPGSGLGNLYEVARELWQVLLLPQLGPEDLPGLRAVQHLLDLLEQHARIQLALQAGDADRALMAQLLQQEMLEETEIPSQLDNGRVKILTLYRLCELRCESDYQLWFDLSSPAWNRPINHPIDNSLLLSRAWPLEARWSLEAEDHFIEERLAALVHKGLQYCRRQPYFFACQYDTLAQMQAFDRLCEIASFAPE